jgi:hypothetical protein
MRQGSRLIRFIVSVVLRHEIGIPVLAKVLPCVGLETTGLTSAPAITVKMHFTILLEKMGHGVAQLIEALRYKPEGRGFDFQWGHWDFH